MAWANAKAADSSSFHPWLREVDGRKSPRRVEIHNDSKLFVEVEVLELQLLERHEESTFKRP